VFSVFAVNNASARLFVLVKIHPVELRVFVNDSAPPVNPYNGNNPIISIREGINFTGKRVKPILLRYY
jgi:hypothetical protein